VTERGAGEGDEGVEHGPAGHAAGSVAGLAFRQCHPDHASVAETVRASAAFPSRFTPPGGRFGVLYVALAPETATAELRRRAAQLGVPIAALAPRAMLTLAVRLRRVLDLTDADTRAAWGLTLEALVSDDYARCQEVAAVAREDGYEAIRYGSAAVVLEQLAAGGTAKDGRQAADNLAIFADRLHPGSDVRIVRSELLPPEEP
jgi:RES domain-containing protein